MKFLIVALALMAMFSTASAQLDKIMALKFFQQMQNKQKGGAAGGINPAAAMLGDMGSELTDYLMLKHFTGAGQGGANAQSGGASGGMFGGMNPLLAMNLDTSDLMMMQMMQNQPRTPGAQKRGQALGMMGGRMQNPLSSLLIADAIGGNDLVTNSLEGLGTMAMLGGLGGGMGMGMGMPVGGMGYGMMPHYPAASYGYPVAATATNAAGASAYGYPSSSAYSARPVGTRGAPMQQYYGQPGMGMGMPGMGMGMMQPNPMKNLMMMDAMTGGDLVGGNDFAKDMGTMMMMNNMMRSPMMGGGYASPYGAYPYYYAHPTAATTATSTPAQPAASTSSGFGSRIKDRVKNKRGGIYDNLWEMSLLQNWLNPAGPKAGAAGGAGKGGVNSAPMDPIGQLAAMEMALGDAVPKMNEAQSAPDAADAPAAPKTAESEAPPPKAAAETSSTAPKKN